MAGIILLILLLLLLKVKIRVKFDGELAVWAQVLFIKIKLFPRPKKKKKPKKIKEKPKKQKKKQEKKSESEAAPKPKVPILDMIKVITDVVKLFFKRFAKHFHIKIAKVNITVATGDAASTAILYGAVSSAVAILVETLNSVTNLDKLKKAEISVTPSYVEEKLSADIDLTFSLRVIGVLDMGLRSLFRFLKLHGRAKSKAQRKQAIAQGTKHENN